MKYTINDIAQICKVGKSTVSRVLNKDPNVKEETRLRVQETIDRLGFQPNRSARAMRGISERVVGIIVTRLNSTSESQTLSKILQELHLQNITPLIVESQFQEELVKRHLQVFRQRQVDGVILFGFSGLSQDALKLWKSSLVTIARQYPGYSAILYDDENAVSYLLTEFYQKGYRHIGYLGVNANDETTGKLRNASYQRFCQKHCMESNSVLGELSAESGYQNITKLFEQEVDAIVCASSSLAIGALKFLQKNEQKVPLACIGKNELLQYLIPDMICLDFGYQTAGHWAVEMLMKQINGDRHIEQRIVPFKLS
ncbi:substrate-binding domain-containing protein [Bibersteinia trehalosi]|uniref:substrate-binding domain-containing protein n=1 Tax=Bibersteinia trehalosi TaxID=47735 RepID=UPI004045A4B0